MQIEGANQRLWLATTAGLVLVAIAVRFSINFSHPYPPGVNAAYYSVQTRSWIEHGRLMYDDLPLIFWLDAGLGRVLAAFGRPLNDAILLATRIVDSTIEPLAAIGIMAFGYAWSRGELKSLAGSLAASTFMVLSPPVMRMLSDFEKNSIGLVLMCAALWACRSALLAPRLNRWMLLGAMLALAAITHVGAFALTLMMVVVALMVWGAVSTRPERRSRAMTLVVAGGVVLLAILAAFDPHRAARLLGVPAAFFRGGMTESLPLPIMVIAAGLVLVVMRIAWRDRRMLEVADIAIVSAAVAALAIVATPKSFVYFNRLMLMAPVPGSLLLAFVVARSKRSGLWVGSSWLVVAVYAAVVAPEAVQPPFMTREIALELQTIKEQIGDPQSTLVIAPHGLEWWAGHILGTPVRSGAPPGIAREYRRVLVLRNTIDCPRDVVNPFAAPPIRDSAVKLYAGRCVELYQAE